MINGQEWVEDAADDARWQLRRSAAARDESPGQRAPTDSSTYIVWCTERGHPGGWQRLFRRCGVHSVITHTVAVRMAVHQSSGGGRVTAPPAKKAERPRPPPPTTDEWWCDRSAPYSTLLSCRPRWEARARGQSTSTAPWAWPLSHRPVEVVGGTESISVAA